MLSANFRRKMLTDLLITFFPHFIREVFFLGKWHIIGENGQDYNAKGGGVYNDDTNPVCCT